LRTFVLLGLALATLLTTFGTTTSAAELTLDSPDTTLPIDLKASFSELDRRNNRLVFRDLRITQGALEIEAKEASANPADFDNSVWVFTGDVRLKNGATEATCDRAELTFRTNQLRRAALSGSPATFTQSATNGKPATTGRSRTLEYDLESQIIQLVADAFLSDGRNQIAGSRIRYDLAREVVSAGADAGGNVQMRITPEKKP
jgi:lipopolysaccharide transport protein LptA